MAANPKTMYTVEEYLAFERQSDTKHEYFAGEIVAMAGASYEHNIIVGNIGAILHGQLRHRACAVVTEPTAAKISSWRPQEGQMSW